MLTSAALPPEEGIGFYVYHLSRELMRNGHNVTIIARGSRRATYVDTVDGISIVRARFLPLYPLHVQFHGLFVRRYLRQSVGLYDVVHAHTPLPPYPPQQFPLVTTVHTPMRADGRSFQVNSVRTLANRAAGLVSQLTERALFKRSQVITSVSNSVARELAEYGLEPSTVRVLGNAVDPAEFRPDAQATSEPPTILYCGRLGERKGLDDLVEAFAMVVKDHPAARLILVGKGPLETELRRKVSRLGIEHNTIFAGHIGADERDRLVHLYQSANVYVQASHYEGLPTSLLEAMACGIPCVATAVSGHLDVVQPGVNGILVPPHRPRLLASAISKLLGEPGMAAALGASGRETVMNKYTWQAVALRYAHAYRDAIAKVNGQVAYERN